jgi:signal transduction histidine kinase
MAGVILICSQCAWLLIYMAESDLRPVTRAVGYIFLVICLLALTRVFVDLVVNPGNDFLTSGMFEALAVLTSQMLIIVLTFGLVLVVNWRLILNLERDIVQHKQVEQELRKLTDVKNRERLARDLHDSVNQSVHSLVLFSETLISTLEKENMARARQIAGRLQESARQALKETRLLLYEIQVPASARNVDLIPDLEARLATVERRAGVKAQILQEGPLDHCPRAWYEDLFGITIEALNNALKHAQARNMQIRIRCSPRHFELEVIDDGIGFDPGKPHAGGLGLQNMRDRANLMGGELTILSTPPKGSCVRFRAEIKE